LGFRVLSRLARHLHAAHGLPLEVSALAKGFQRFLKTAKLPKFRFNDLRHT
jgi:hypothetical protein